MADEQLREARPEVAREALDQVHRPVLPAGAADRDREISAVRLLVLRQPPLDEAHEVVDHPFDARTLPNPYWEQALKPLTGRDAKVVEFLEAHPAVSQVIYPGLEAHPGHEVASRQMKRYGGIVSFRVADGEQKALDTCAKAQVFTLGESLGGVESLIEHPGRMTHASVAGTELEVPADLIRLSVGIETAEDLIADLDQALS